MIDELVQQPAGPLQLVSEGSSLREVGVHGGVQVSHHLTAGHGRARAASVSWSTVA